MLLIMTEGQTACGWEIVFRYLLYSGTMNSLLAVSHALE